MDKPDKWCLIFPIKRIYNCQGDLYLTRVKLLVTPWFSIYWHRFNRSDEDRALHDHPWPFISIPIWPGYFEWLPKNWYGNEILCQSRGVVLDKTVDKLAFGQKRKLRFPLWPLFRKATAAHRVQLFGRVACDQCGSQRGFFGLSPSVDATCREFGCFGLMKRKEIITYSLVIVGRKTRSWGYHEKDGWIGHHNWWNRQNCDENF